MRLRAAAVAVVAPARCGKREGSSKASSTMQVVASISESKNGKLSHSVSLQALEIALQLCLCLLFLSGEVFFQLFFFIFLPSMLPSKAFSALILSNIIIVRDFWDSVSERMGGERIFGSRGGKLYPIYF